MKRHARFRQYLTVWVFSLCCMATVANALNDWDRHSAQNATVFINTKNGIGNGFFVAPYLIVTGAHLVENSPIHEIKIKGYATKSEIKCIEVVETLPQHFLAVLRVNTQGSAPVFADGNTIQSNESVYIVGYPGGQRPFFKPVTTLNPSGHCKVKIKLPLTIESDGGLVLNFRGQVIGIHFAGWALEAELQYKFSFAVPINALRHLIKDGHSFTISIPLTVDCQTILRNILRGNALAKKVVWAEEVKYIDGFLRIVDDFPKSRYKERVRNFYSILREVSWKKIGKIFRIIF